ncbi:MAG TPA: c-type cytochrome [Anaeromyxobacteraceae bacterium]|nr:c-type cytochrome [Anaeromyxobacteraceae bacterium]
MNRIVAALAVCLAVALAAPARAADDGKALFAQKCASCHGPDGKGKTPMGQKLGAKDLTHEDKEPLDEIVKDIENGKPPKMAAYKGKLSAEQIKAVAAYIKGGLK